jgi:hypothetical protein
MSSYQALAHIPQDFARLQEHRICSSEHASEELQQVLKRLSSDVIRPLCISQKILHVCSRGSFRQQEIIQKQAQQ